MQEEVSKHVRKIHSVAKSKRLSISSKDNKSLYDKYAINPAKKIVRMVEQELAN